MFFSGGMHALKNFSFSSSDLESKQITNHGKLKLASRNWAEQSLTVILVCVIIVVGQHICELASLWIAEVNIIWTSSLTGSKKWSHAAGVKHPFLFECRKGHDFRIFQRPVSEAFNFCQGLKIYTHCFLNLLWCLSCLNTELTWETDKTKNQSLNDFNSFTRHSKVLKVQHTLYNPAQS